jgi:hypothetical protein
LLFRTGQTEALLHFRDLGCGGYRHQPDRGLRLCLGLRCNALRGNDGNFILDEVRLAEAHRADLTIHGDDPEVLAGRLVKQRALAGYGGCRRHNIGPLGRWLFRGIGGGSAGNLVTGKGNGANNSEPGERERHDFRKRDRLINVFDMAVSAFTHPHMTFES